MPKVKKHRLPERAFLTRYNEAYTDCYIAELEAAIDLNTFVVTFYTGRLFRMERWLLGKVVRKPSSDEQLEQMLSGQIDRFAAWTVEDRIEHQLLMCDYQKRTRSWFMVEQAETKTTLFFGSAVVPTNYLKPGPERFSDVVFKALLPFHKLYSRLLLGSAARRLCDNDNL